MKVKHVSERTISWEYFWWEGSLKLKQRAKRRWKMKELYTTKRGVFGGGFRMCRHLCVCCYTTCDSSGIRSIIGSHTVHNNSRWKLHLVNNHFCWREKKKFFISLTLDLTQIILDLLLSILSDADFVFSVFSDFQCRRLELASQMQNMIEKHSCSQIISLLYLVLSL